MANPAGDDSEGELKKKKKKPPRQAVSRSGTSLYELKD
jgi:hypothetical protein